MTTKKVTVLISGAGAAMALALCLYSYSQNGTMQQRVHDVRVLTSLHVKHQYTNQNIHRLLEITHSEGVKLFNPIAINPALPSYEIAKSFMSAVGQTDPLAVEIESSN